MDVGFLGVPERDRLIVFLEVFIVLGHHPRWTEYFKRLFFCVGSGIDFGSLFFIGYKSVKS
jgi:hypothetical protein